MVSGIVIGGPPSSGSSLLTDLIGRHSAILSFPETHVLAKPVLWQNWKENKEELFTHKWKSPDWHLQSGIDHIQQTRMSEQFKKESHSVVEFANSYFSALANQKGKQIWCEKTPANVYFFNKLRSAPIDTIPILCMRNPYDSIASLLFRKSSLLDAVCRILVNFAFGFAQSQATETIHIKYEKLVTQPEVYLQKLFQQLGIPFENQLLTNRNGNTRMEGWKHAEDGIISTSSIGRFSELSIKQQANVVYASEKIKINKAHLEAYGLQLETQYEFNLSSLATNYGYMIPQIEGKFIDLSTPIITDKLKRKIRAYPSLKPYPILL